jgi:hypothetical protein
MTRTTAIVLATLVVCTLNTRTACAQSAPATGPGRIEASIGALWVGRQALGAADANETTPTGGALKIFTTSTELAAVSGFEARVAVRVGRSLEVEMEGSYGQPELRVAISADSEGAPNSTAVEQVQQFTIGGGAVWYLPRLAPRLAPFVTGGLGQLRQMHQDRIALETGLYYQVGGGVKYFFFSRPGGFFNAFGARADVRALVRIKGVAFDESGHASPAVGVSAFVRF